MKTPFAYCLLIVGVLWSLHAAAQPLEIPKTPAMRWHWSRPSGGGMDLLALTYGDGLWVAVGEGGMVLTSRDALTWQEQVTDVSDNLSAVAWKPGGFVAAGRDSILFSRDGVHWSLINGELTMLTASPTRYLAYGRKGNALWSADGTTWHPGERPKGETYSYLKWGGSSFLAGIDKVEWTSADGESWKRVENPKPGMKRVFGLVPESRRSYDAQSLDQKTKETLSWTAHCFMAANQSHLIGVTEVGRVFRSEDGVAWEALPTRHPYLTKAVEWADGKFVAVGEMGRIATSEDGLNWRLVTSRGGAVRWMTSSEKTALALRDNGSAVVFENGKATTHSFPALDPSVGSSFCHTPHGFVFYSSQSSTRIPDVVILSTDGRRWSYNILPERKYSPEMMTVAGSRLVAMADDGTGFFSDDGTQWHEANEKIPWYPDGMVAHGGKFIAVGDTRGGFISTSLDGESWETSALKLPARIKTITSNGLTCLIVTKEGEVFRSPDVREWTQCVFPPEANINALAWSVDRFLAAGQSGGFYTSPDGVKWTPTTLNGPRSIHLMVSRPGGGFIATDHFQLLESKDGRDWQLLTAPQDYGGGLMACAFNGNSFVTAGFGFSATSADGVDWVSHRIEGSPELTDVCWGNNRWVATSTKHGFYYSSDGANWTKSLTAVPAQTMRTVVWTGKEFLAGGNSGVLYSSSDGRLWRESRPQTVEAFLDLAVSDEHVLALMSGNVTLKRSIKPAGSWQTVPTGLPTELLRLNWDGNRFLAVGQDRIIYSSAEGQSWTEETSAAGGTRAVASGGGWYATAGGFGTLALSQDLKQWGQQSLDDGMLLLDVCYGKARFVAIGMLGQIVHSDVIPRTAHRR